MADISLSKKRTDYIKIARMVCNILGIDVSSDREIGIILEKLERWVNSVVYCTSTQRDIINNVRQIVEDITRKENEKKILQRVEKLRDDIVFDRDFD